MKRYVQIINEDTKQVSLGMGTNTTFYKSIGMTEMEVEQAYNGQWYVAGYAPTQPIEEVRQAKLSELSAQALAFEDNVNKSMYFISSVFVEKEVQKDDETTETIKEHLVINGDRRTRSNLQDLIAYQPTDNVIYRDYNNQERTLTKEQLQVILKEHVVNGEAIYHQKWEYEAKIKACTTIEELNAIEIKFTMHDFSKEEVVADE